MLSNSYITKYVSSACLLFPKKNQSLQRFIYLFLILYKRGLKVQTGLFILNVTVFPAQLNWVINILSHIENKLIHLQMYQGYKKNQSIREIH